MNSLSRQLHVDRQQAAELANQLVDGEFVCPLGGEYLLVEVPGGIQAWASTAAAPNNQFLLTEIPPDYHFPLVSWFRGLTAELVRDGDALTLSCWVEMTPNAGADQQGRQLSTDDVAKPSVPLDAPPAQPALPEEKSVLKRDEAPELLPVPRPDSPR